MIFKTYIFEYFKVEIVDHSLGLLIWVFGVCIAFFTSDGKRLCKHFLSIAQSRIWNIENKYLTSILRNKRETKCKTEKFLLNLFHVGFYWLKHKEQTLCLGFQKVPNCQGWNVEPENSTTHKRWNNVSGSNFGMDATPFRFPQ